MFLAASKFPGRPLSFKSLSARARSARMSSSSGPQRHLFLVYAPDKTDPDALKRRLSVREQHLANAKKLRAEDTVGTSYGPPSIRMSKLSALSIVMGGAMVTEDSLTSAQKKMTGSTLLVRGVNSEEVRKLVESDVYYTSDVVSS